MNTLIDRCESTNDLARRLADEGAPHGTWIAARMQSAGRGRLGREWRSLEGNLFLSWIARPTDPARVTWIPLMAAVSIAEELRARLAIPLRIKWPNDLWLKGGVSPAKIGGILCEGTPGQIVIGVGLNCAQSPRETETPATSLSAAVGREIFADEVLPWVVDALDRGIREPLGSIVEKYERWALFDRGTRVTWRDGARRGRVQGLGPSGELLVRADDRESSGELERLFAEDVARVQSLNGGLDSGSRADNDQRRVMKGESECALEEA
jgi:BirA family transcriptional regulator, biotin operon repressor / biotin---[acetyl-CoA-carboxylase] ligase